MVRDRTSTTDEKHTLNADFELLLWDTSWLQGVLRLFQLALAIMTEWQMGGQAHFTCSKKSLPEVQRRSCHVRVGWTWTSCVSCTYNKHNQIHMIRLCHGCCGMPQRRLFLMCFRHYINHLFIPGYHLSFASSPQKSSILSVTCVGEGCAVMPDYVITP